MTMSTRPNSCRWSMTIQHSSSKTYTSPSFADHGFHSRLSSINNSKSFVHPLVEERSNHTSRSSNRIVSYTRQYTAPIIKHHNDWPFNKLDYERLGPFQITMQINPVAIWPTLPSCFFNYTCSTWHCLSFTMHISTIPSRIPKPLAIV